MVTAENVRISSGEEHLKVYLGKHVLGVDLDCYFCNICPCKVWNKLQVTAQVGLWVSRAGTLNPLDGKMGTEVEPPKAEAFTMYNVSPCLTATCPEFGGREPKRSDSGAITSSSRYVNFVQDVPDVIGRPQL